MKQSIRLFSIGLITAGLIMLVVYLFNDSDAVQAELTTDEMISHLEKQNMRVMPEDEYIALSVDKSNQAKETDNDDPEQADEEQTTSDDKDPSSEEASNDPEENNNDEEQDESASSTSLTFTVEPGMSSTDISTTLEEKGIIDDAEAFNVYLQENDYSMLIQIGTFDVDSSMSSYELAETLTNP